MEINILEESKNKLQFEIKGESHTLCNALKDELQKNSKVKATSYKVEHPLVGVPKMIIETDGSESPRAALSKAAKKIGSNADDLKKMFTKELK